MEGELAAPLPSSMPVTAASLLRAGGRLVFMAQSMLARRGDRDSLRAPDVAARLA